MRPSIGPIALTTQTNGGDGNYSWLWSNGLSAPNNQLPEGFSGSVWVFVTDQSGCTAIAQTTISGPINVLAITDVPSDAQAADGRIELIVYGGAKPYSFMWSNGATDQNISGLSSGTYTVTVTGSNGCTTEITIPLSMVGAEIASALQSVAIYPESGEFW